jgi:hypothetical protein
MERQDWMQLPTWRNYLHKESVGRMQVILDYTELNSIIACYLEQLGLTASNEVVFSHSSESYEGDTTQAVVLVQYKDVCKK